MKTKKWKSSQSGHIVQCYHAQWNKRWHSNHLSSGLTSQLRVNQNSNGGSTKLKEFAECYCVRFLISIYTEERTSASVNTPSKSSMCAFLLGSFKSQIYPPSHLLFTVTSNRPQSLENFKLPFIRGVVYVLSKKNVRQRREDFCHSSWMSMYIERSVVIRCSCSQGLCDQGIYVPLEKRLYIRRHMSVFRYDVDVGNNREQCLAVGKIANLLVWVTITWKVS